MTRTILSLMLLLVGCGQSRLGEKLAAFTKSGALFRMSTCLCPGQRLTRAEATFGEWPSRLDCYSQNTTSLEALLRVSQDKKPVAVVFRHDVGLEFARETIFLEPSGATLFHEALDCERGTIGCGDLIERREPGGATVTVLPGAYRRSCDGAPPDLANATFTNAFISASSSPSSVTWASELPSADAAQNPRVGCDGATHAATFWKDGICDAYFNCAQSEFDGGDCP